MEAKIIDSNRKEAPIHSEGSKFTETLMRVAGAIGNLVTHGDCAIVLASDGQTLSSRIVGMYPDVLNMVYVKMVNDDDFAELIIEAAMLYSGRKTENYNVIKQQYDNEEGKDIEEVEPAR